MYEFFPEGVPLTAMKYTTMAGGLAGILTSGGCECHRFNSGFYHRIVS